jgi:hypothetical protein
MLGCTRQGEQPTKTIEDNEIRDGNKMSGDASELRALAVWVYTSQSDFEKLYVSDTFRQLAFVSDCRSNRGITTLDQ